ncbi:uncharacterized protein B3gp35 [Nephila pilipes]|uniref:Uncharacterized protein B3gp35 n=1 Tax=Nephila pilipes TaxID=299642 RepID=A0A8X6QLH6_NEPPI|nr:uncharacterized protein B3gp35 [Nephila pilipes]
MVADGPSTNDEEATKWRKSVGSRRVYVVDPWVKVFIDGKEETLPSSPFVAGLIAKVDSEQSFWHSLNAKKIDVLLEQSRPIDFTLAIRSSRQII